MPQLYLNNIIQEDTNMTLAEKIAKIDPEKVISLKNRYGIFFTGKAKYVFSHVTYKAWNGTDVEVVI